MTLPKKLTKQWRKSLSSKYPFPKLVLNKKNKNEYTEYHGISIPLKSQVYSKHGSPTFLSFGSWSLVLYLHVLVKAIFFWIIRFSDGVCTFFKKTFLLFKMALLKCFICSRVGILNSPWWNSYSFDQEKVPFLLIYLLPTKYNKKNHTYLNLVYSICHRVELYRLVKLLISTFCYYF